MKLFRTTNMEIITACQEIFHCELPNVLLIERYKFIVLNGQFLSIKFIYTSLITMKW